MKTFFLLAFVLLFKISFTQDSVAKDWRFQKQVVFWYKYQDADYNSRVVMPGVIRSIRNWSTQLPVDFEHVTDNPLMHGATYVAFKTQTDYKNKLSLFADIYGEHRGMSYGLFDQENTLVYPIIRVEAKDTFKVFSKTLVLWGKVGQFVDERMDEGLMIYNIDMQGMSAQAHYKDYCFQYTLYGDLCMGIGLNIDDLEALSLSRTFKNQSVVGFSRVSAKPTDDRTKHDYTLNLFASRPFKKGRLYSQLAMKPYDGENSSSALKETSSKMAFVLGLNHGRTFKKFSYNADASLRYYGFTYNFLHSDARLRYRKPANNYGDMYANTVGDYLYPLRKFDTPFSQWAVYTEYWAGFNVATAIVTGNLNYRFAKKFAGNMNYDFNYVYAADAQKQGLNSSWLYPFYNLSLVYLPIDNLQVKGGIANKVMNLDLSYPTHYMLEKPCFELSIRGEF